MISTRGLGDSLIAEMARNADAAARLGAFDPLLTAARFAAAGRWGPGISSMLAGSAMRFPSRIAIADDDGDITYSQLDRQTSNVAAHLRRNAGSGAVGVLCRNHRGFVVAQVGAERAGLDVVLLSTALPGPQLRDVAGREGIEVIIADGEFVALVGGSVDGVALIDATADGSGSLRDIAATRAPCPLPSRRSRLVMLTSGTTGPPKGARRENRAAGADSLGMFSQVPFRLGDRYLVCPPLFHAWGLSQSTIAIATASTLHLRRTFDVAATIALLTEHRIDVLAVVPLMLRRLLREGPVLDEIRPPRMVLSSGNVLSGDLALEWMDRMGDRLYNFYGSTETAIGTIADPVELRESPGTVGRAPSGVTIGILDPEGMPVPAGAQGRVHLASGMQFAGYTDGTDRERRGTLMATGDLGYLDPTGRLHVEGRVNDMIVTGGENVFPSRVEEVLEQHPGIDMVAVVGVDDKEWGQRIEAFVVPLPGVDLTAEDVQAAAADELEAFMVPREVRFVDSLPMTTTGKVIRHRLAVLGQADRV